MIIFFFFFPEWYVLQITTEHEPLTETRHYIQQNEFSYSLKPSHGLHLMVLPTGANNTMDPICITVPKPNLQSTYDVRIEIETLLNNNKTDLTSSYSNKNLYWKMRRNQNNKMKVSFFLTTKLLESMIVVYLSIYFFYFYLIFKKQNRLQFGNWKILG